MQFNGLPSPWGRLVPGRATMRQLLYSARMALSRCSWFACIMLWDMRAALRHTVVAGALSLYGDSRSNSIGVNWTSAPFSTAPMFLGCVWGNRGQCPSGQSRVIRRLLALLVMSGHLNLSLETCVAIYIYMYIYIYVCVCLYGCGNMAILDCFSLSFSLPNHQNPINKHNCTVMKKVLLCLY